MDIIQIIVMATFGLLCGACAVVNGNNLHFHRFGEDLYKGKKEWIKGGCLEIMLCTLSGVLFTYYGYDVIKSMEYIILIATLVIAGRIDRKKMIIPNQCITFLLVIRIVFYIIEYTADKENAVMNIVSGIAGIFIGTILFILARLVKKGSVGMGDIKLFASLGFYLGCRNVMYVMVISLFIAMISCMIKLVKKQLAMKEKFSLGPFISTGAIMLMMLGL